MASSAGRNYPMDRRDFGNLPQHLVPVSHEMMKVLRYNKKGLWLNSEGWVPLVRLLSLNRFMDFCEKDIETVVRES